MSKNDDAVAADPMNPLLLRGLNIVSLANEGSVLTTTDQRASETEARALIESWARAVQARDLDGVLTDHSDDIQMFDVPPPNELRGIEAYRKTWPPFFEWLTQGAMFEIVSLDVTAGADVAFATALLRCGTEEGLRKDPETRLRLTVGLRKEGGRWVVSHEHHSFPALD
jgi:uncharacterized protein (TIGR02246 family)